MNNINLFEIVNKLANKKELTIKEKRINDEAIKKAHAHGYNSTSQFNFEMRDLINGNNMQNVEVKQYLTKDNDNINTLFEKVVFVDNSTSSYKFPFVEFNNVAWGIPNDSITIENKKTLKANRLAAKISLSKSVLQSNENIEEQLTELAITAIYQKLFESIFSNSSGDTEQPEGIIYNISAYTLSDVESLTNLQYNIDKFADNCIWLISPKAKQKLNEINATSKIFDNGKLLNSDYIFTNLVNDGYLLYVDLSKLVISQFGVCGITCDTYTQAKEGKVIITLDTYFDYSFADNKYLGVGVFE